MLERNLSSLLLEAITQYNFPFVTFEFVTNKEIQHESMFGVEATIKQLLLSNNPELVKDGLSNILYWGYSRTGYRRNRIEKFRSQVSDSQLTQAGSLFLQMSGVGIRQIAGLDLPEFSFLSFLSKIRMFLNPADYVVLDIQILKLRQQPRLTVLSKIAWTEKSSIRATKNNESVYEQWCKLCGRIAREEFSNINLRAVDIERGIFHLVQTKRASLAAEILATA